MAYQVERSVGEKLKEAIPFGLGSTKPKHFRDMLKVVWQNRDNLGYAFKVLTRGVCDGCALGVAGLHDWTIQGVHLCMTRLNLLRLNTMPGLDSGLLADCSKLEKLSNAELRELGRIPHPMLREKGDRGFRRVTWDEAYDRIARRIQTSTPSRIGFFVTARGVTNEIYYVAQKVARYLGTPNVDNAARLCHAPSTSAMRLALGVTASTCSYKDWYGTDLIVFFGSNPANDQPVTTKYLHEAKKLGTKVVMVNPYLEPGMKRYWVPSSAGSALFGTGIADYWFPVTQGGDIAFLYGVVKILIGNGWIDQEFVRERCVDFEELKHAAELLDWGGLEAQAGLPRAAMEEFAALIRDAKNAVLVWSMGITQHSYGSDAVQMIMNLGLLRGYVGRDKCGLMPIRGHSSVQGGAEMGAYSSALPGGKPVTKENAEALSRAYGFPIPASAGMTTVEMLEACGRGEFDLLYSLGGNFLRTLPEPEHVRRCLSRTPMRVHQDIILTDQMLLPSEGEVLLLPAKTRYEQEGGGIETTTERRIAFSPEIPRQIGECKAEWRILLELAARAKPEQAHLLGCGTAGEIRKEIARMVPFYEGCQHLAKTGDSVQYGGPHLCADGAFPTPDGKAHFKAAPLPKLEREEREFEVSTRRGKQFNTLVYAEVDPLNGAGRDAVLMAPSDAAALGLRNHDRIRLSNDLGSYDGAVFLAPIAPGNLQIHWPEGNVIVRKGVVDPRAGVPDYNTRAKVAKI